jgi:hypothetical protein
MAISRPFLLALLGALLLGSTVLAVQNARTAADGDVAPALVQTDGATAPAKTSSGPADTLRSAFNLSDLESARFVAKVGFTGPSAPAGKFQVSGAFQTGDAKEIPKFNVNLRLSAGRQSAGGGLVSLGDKAYFVRGDTGWRVPAQIWTPLVATVATGGPGGGAVQGNPLNLHPANWVRDVKSEGTDTVSGVAAEHVSARVDSQAVVNDLAQAARQSGAELPGQAAASRAVKRADLDVWVGSDDDILRRFSAQVVFPGGGRLNLDVRLSDVNKPQRIEAPAHVRVGAPDGASGSFAEFITGAIAGFTGSEPTSLAALTSPNPRRAARAVRDHNKVVILFRNPRGLDDRAMVSVMRDVDRRTQALVLTDEVDAVERYGKLVEDLGVSQTPSIVIIDRSGRAQLIEGYVDSNTLTQAVADAR